MTEAHSIYSILDWSWLLLIPGIIISLWAQYYVQNTYAKYAKINIAAGITGARFAEVMLKQNKADGIRIGAVSGELTDHFDPRNNTVSLSQNVFGGTSISSVAIAAHECGHVLQHTTGYGPIKARTALVPVVGVISRLCFPMIFLGIILSFTPFIRIAAWAYLGICIFQIVTLPVEFNASKRAIENIKASNVMTEEELPGAKKVLRAAAMTYVAALLVTLLQFFRLLALSRRR